MGKTGTKLRLKLVGVGADRILLARVVGYSDRLHKALLGTLIGDLPDQRVQFDGEILRLRGRGLDAVVERAGRVCQVVYDPGLERALPGLPSPWELPEEPARDRRRTRVFMARVRHPDLAESLAFHTPQYDDDFIIDFRRATAHARQWRRFRGDFKVWVVAEHYEDVVHGALDRHFDCAWDEFMAGEEWDILPPPPDTRYPVRTLEAADFAVLRVPPFCSTSELNHGYQQLKEAYKGNQIGPDEWLDIDEAYERIRRHHNPGDAEALPPPVGPLELLRLLRSWIPEPAEQSRWFHRFNPTLDGTPADLVGSAEGAARVDRYIRVLMAVMPPARG